MDWKTKLNEVEAKIIERNPLQSIIILIIVIIIVDTQESFLRLKKYNKVQITYQYKKDMSGDVKGLNVDMKTVLHFPFPGGDSSDCIDIMSGQIA